MIQWLRKVSLFDSLTDEQLEHVLRIAQRRSLSTGTVLFHEKDPGSIFYVVLSGSIKLYTRSASGEEKILSVVAAGDSFGELALLDGRPRSASAQTLETTLVLEIVNDAFMNLLEAHFDITRGILAELSRRLRQTNEHVNDLTFLDDRTRVLKNLILLANQHGKRDGMFIYIHIPLNYDELAQMAGVSKSVLSDVLRELESRGVLQFGLNEYKLNLAKLRN
ncbi:catabolite gene activator [Cohnella xylanilytica]|uniref:Crp/Fnr family transcriptional regulator n=1 Tax=Cohnella xylanilytica TaxID=557555 RepID=A0A841TW14_9BACL|nr:Crp/Fnr family transcriptional regulator [Cohnella xylanilytica]MBB6692375.1 Crp/Fnr family transcriptional regulator [Cohnella xylanilytica]GIO12507.1 catabolite gene activator [Cohnella xylanilytica]